MKKLIVFALLISACDIRALEEFGQMKKEHELCSAQRGRLIEDLKECQQNRDHHAARATELYMEPNCEPSEDKPEDNWGPENW